MSTALVKFVPRIGDIIQIRPDHPAAVKDMQWRQAPCRWRVTGYMKPWKPRRPKGPFSFSTVLQSVLDNANREFDMGKGPTRLQWCGELEAEYVTGAGVSGCCYPLEDVIVVGRVKWGKAWLDYTTHSTISSWGKVLF